MQLHKLACSYISLHAVPWAWIQFYELVCNSFLCLSSSQEFRSACFQLKENKNFSFQVPDHLIQNCPLITLMDVSLHLKLFCLYEFFPPNVLTNLLSMSLLSHSWRPTIVRSMRLAILELLSLSKHESLCCRNGSK